MDDETKSRRKVFDVVQKCYSHIWGEFNEDQLTVRRFQTGFVNEVYYCAINDVEGKRVKGCKEIVVRFNGREDSGGVEDIIPNDETSLALIGYILGEKKLGPKVFVIFPGGRIEEFIDSYLITDKQLRNKRVIEIIARHLARMHLLDIPVPRVNDAIGMLDRLAKVPMSAGGVAWMETMKVNISEERKWMREMLQKLKSKLVFSHGDMNRHNILVRKAADDDLTDNDVVVIDYDLCCYSHPCHDMSGYLFNFAFEMTEEPPYMHVRETLATEEEKRVLIREYLREKRKISAIEKMDESEEDNMSLEVDFFGVYGCLMGMSMFLSKVDGEVGGKLGQVDMKGMVGSCETNYIRCKKVFLERPNWNRIFNK